MAAPLQPEENQSQQTTSDISHLVMKKPNKVVRFPSTEANMNLTRRVSDLSTYSAPEKYAVWGNKAEQLQKRLQLKQEIIEYAQGRRLSDNQTFSSIGIVDKILDGKKAKDDIRHAARQVVLDEQYFQLHMKAISTSDDGRSNGNSNDSSVGYNNSVDEIIASVYMEVTLNAQQRAHEEAMELRRFIDDEVLELGIEC